MPPSPSAHPVSATKDRHQVFAATDAQPIERATPYMLEPRMRTGPEFPASPTVRTLVQPP